MVGKSASAPPISTCVLCTDVHFARVVNSSDGSALSGPSATAGAVQIRAERYRRGLAEVSPQGAARIQELSSRRSENCAREVRDSRTTRPRLGIGGPP